jgi:rhodanese-related sulfurtransferase
MSEYIDKIRFDTQIAEDFFAEKLAFTLGPVELQHMLAENKVKLIDVRRKEDYDEGHIPEAISIPKEELTEKLAQLSENDVHVVYCYNQQCHLGAAAALSLAKHGYPVMELEGGFDAWAEDFKFEVAK